jgi:hypothetical protein
MPASHLGKPRLAGLHDFVQVLEGAVLDLNWLSFAPMHNPFDTKHSCLSSNTHVSHRHCLPGRLALRLLLFPVRPHIDLVPSAAALGADHPRAEVRDFSVGRVAPHFD